MIRFLHAADLHLDSPFKGMSQLPQKYLEQLRESTFQAFQKLIDYAVTHRPDFVLLVGDLYDGEHRSLRAQQLFVQGMERLQEASIPVFLSYGNHDHLKGQWVRFTLPENVHVFEETVSQKTIRVQNQSVHLYGFSYPERHVRDSMTVHYPVATDRDAFHIGMLHGSIDGNDQHAVYAPFTKEQLLEKNYDYWALGHIHTRQQLHDDPLILYPGNLQGRHRNEQGVKGFADVKLTKQGATYEWIPTSEIVFQRLSISCASIRHANEWLTHCQDALERLTEEVGNCIVELEMINITPEANELFQQASEKEWLEAIREIIRNDRFVWVERLSFEPVATMTHQTSLLTENVLSIIEQWDINEVKQQLKELYQHPRGGKYLSFIDSQQVHDMKAKAKQLLLQEMQRLD